MGDMAERFNAQKAHNKEARRTRHEAAEQEATLDWTKHSEFHWQIQLNGKPLDYWPSTNRCRYNGRTFFCGAVVEVENFYRKRVVPE